MRFSIHSAAALAVVLTAVGCASGPQTVRGQSPQYGPAGGPVDISQHPAARGGQMQPGGQIQQVGHHRGVRSHPVYDATLGQHASQETAHYAGHSGMGQSEYSFGGCPSGSCQQGGACGAGGCSPLNPKCVRDARSYSYTQPKNLSYPSQGATGGAIVYPYYTHKGPSDFFRQ